MKKYRIVIMFLVYVLLVYGGLAIAFESTWAVRFARKFLQDQASRQGIELGMDNLDIDLLDLSLEFKGVHVSSPKLGLFISADQVGLTFRPIYLLSGVLGFQSVELRKATVRWSVVEGSKKKLSKSDSKQNVFDILSTFLGHRMGEVTVENVQVSLETPWVTGRCAIDSIALEQGLTSPVAGKIVLGDCPLSRPEASEFEKENPVKSLEAEVVLRDTEITVTSLSVLTPLWSSAVSGSLKKPNLLDIQVQAKSLGAVPPTLGHRKMEASDASADVRLHGSLDKLNLEGDVNVTAFRPNPETLLDHVSLKLAGPLLAPAIKRGEVRFGQSSLLATNLSLVEGKIEGKISGEKVHVREVQALLDKKPNTLLSGMMDLNLELKGSLTAEKKLNELRIEGPIAINQFRVSDQRDVEIIRVESLQIPAHCLVQPKKTVCDPLPLSANGVILETRVESSKETVIYFESKDFDVAKITPHIADFLVKGHGTAKGVVRVRPGHENMLTVDGEVALKEAKMDVVDFGDVRMRVTYDWDRDILGFRDAKLKRSPGLANVNLELEFGDKTLLKGKFQLEKATGEDLAGWGFNYLPDYVQFSGGVWTGEGSFSGQARLGHFSCQLDLQGEQSQWLYQRFDRLRLKGAGDAQGIRITDFDLARGDWNWSGELSAQTSRALKGSLTSSNMRLADVVLTPGKRLPLEGRARLKMDLSGTIERPDVSVSGATDDLKISQWSLGPVEVKYVASLDKTLMDARLGPKDKLLLELQEKRVRISYSLDQRDIFPLLLVWLPLKTKSGNQLMVTASGDVELVGSELALKEMSHQVQQVLLVTPTTQLRVDPFRIRAQGDSVPVNLVLKTQENQLSLSGSLNAKGDGVLQLRGGTGLGWLADWMDVVDWSQGELSFDGSMIVRQWIPLGLRGRSRIHQGALSFSFLDERLEDVEGNIAFQDNKIILENAQARMGDGEVTLKGESTYPWGETKNLSLITQFHDVKLRPYPEIFLVANGKLSISGQGKPFDLKGDVQITRAELAGDQLSQELANKETESRFLPQQFQHGEREWFRLDTQVKIPSRFRIESQQFSGEIQGDFRLMGTDVKPVILGNILIANGEMAIRDNNFVIDAGSLRFENQSRIDPLLNVSSHWDVVAEERTYRIYLNILGTWDRPRLEYSSDPPLSQEDITSLVVFGVTTQKFDERVNSGVVQQELVPQLFARSGVSRSLEKSTGFRVRLDTNYSDTREGALPRISVSRKVGRDVELKFISNLDNETHREFNVQYQINNNVSLRGLWEGRQEATTDTTTPNEELRNSFGGDVQFKVEFE